jgi:hypothetical protein
MKYLYFSYIVLALVTIQTVAFADNVGIVNVRLIELDDNQYVLEANASPVMIAGLRNPVIPMRFTLEPKPQYIRQPGQVTIRYVFRDQESLNANDILILPWSFTAAFVTAQWKDGSSHNGLFTRGIEGIRVPIRFLQQVVQTNSEMIYEFGWLGINYSMSAWCLWLLIAAIALCNSWRTIYTLIGLFIAGHVCSVVVGDFDLVSFPSVIGESLICFFVVLFIRDRLKSCRTGSDLSVKKYSLSLLVLGFLHGSGCIQLVEKQVGNTANSLVAAFSFVTTIDLFLLVFACGFWLIQKVILHRFSIQSTLSTFTGSAGVALFLTITTMGFEEHRNQAIDTADRMSLARFEFKQMGVDIGGIAPRQRNNAPRTMNEPIMSFLTIEPYEIRHEVLLSVKELEKWTDSEWQNQPVLSVEEQADFKRRILRHIQYVFDLQVDNKHVAPIFQQADFISLGLTGAIIRTTPQTEYIDSAIVGLTFAYEIEEPPHTVTVDWSQGLTAVEKIPATISDPASSVSYSLILEKPFIQWKNTLLSFKPQEIRAVVVAKPAWPIFSMLFLICSIIFFGLTYKRKQAWVRTAAYILVLIAYLLYPFARVQATVPFVETWKPSTEQASTVLDYLLTNVYRAFDFRNESIIYDRLAFSVIGEQLSDIYLEQRRGLELENRGGARARVNDVEIISVNSVKSDPAEGFRVTATWKVSGSVSHFGHTHYRQNRYSAVIWLVVVNNTWKIKEIELLDEKRLL